MKLHEPRFGGLGGDLKRAIAANGGEDALQVLGNLAMVELQRGRTSEAIANQKQMLIGMRRVGTRKQAPMTH